MDRMARVGGIAAVQPSFVVTDAPWVRKCLDEDMHVC